MSAPTATREQVEAAVQKALRQLDWLADQGKRSGTVHLFGEAMFVRANASGEYTVRALWTTHRGLEYEDLEPLFASIAEQARRDRLASDREETTQETPEHGKGPRANGSPRH